MDLETWEKAKDARRKKQFLLFEIHIHYMTDFTECNYLVQMESSGKIRL